VSAKKIRCTLRQAQHERISQYGFQINTALNPPSKRHLPVKLLVFPGRLR
jgi:hypothetical protein